MKTYLLDQLEKVARRLGPSLINDRSFDVVDMAFLRAGLDTAEFYEQHLMQATAFKDHNEMIAHAVGLAEVDGLVLEFGVATGSTITEIARARSGPVFGFDSFEGLPEDWYGPYGKGSFARSDLPVVPDNVTLVKGWFTDTLPRFLDEHTEPVSFLHVDSDLYSSASFLFKSLPDRIVPGTVILFDEYFNYPGWREHEHKAWQEFVVENDVSFRYDSFLRVNQAVCVVVG